MKQWISCVVVEEHGVRRPHQLQDLVIRDLIPDLIFSAPKGKSVKKRNDKERLRIAAIVSKRIRLLCSIAGYKRERATTKIVKKLLREELTRNGYHPELKDNPRWCDIHTSDERKRVHQCAMDDEMLVVRALSKTFEVNTQKVQFESEIVLSEVVLSGFGSESEARIEAIRLASELEDPLTLETLGCLKRPVEHGYSEWDVCSAMEPFIRKHNYKYCSEFFPEEDGLQHGYIGVIQALRTDRALAPFSTHAFRHTQTNVRRSVSNSGLIRHGERDGDFHGTKGILLGVDDDGNKIYGRLQSAEVKIGGEDLTIYDLHEKQDADPGPLEMAEMNEEHKIAASTLEELIKRANLTIQQKTVLDLYSGLNTHIDNPYDPTEDSENHKKWEEDGWEHTGTEIAKIMKCTRQRVGQQKEKSMDKLVKAGEQMIAETDDTKVKKFSIRAVQAVLLRLDKEKPLWDGKKFINPKTNKPVRYKRGKSGFHVEMDDEGEDNA